MTKDNELHIDDFGTKKIAWQIIYIYVIHIFGKTLNLSTTNPNQSITKIDKHYGKVQDYQTNLHLKVKPFGRSQNFVKRMGFGFQ